MGMEFKVHSPVSSLDLSHYRPLLQSDLEQWRAGCVYYDSQDYDSALRTFMRIGDNARMHFNIGLIFSILQDHRRSVAAFKKALELDPFFAVACFQRGVSHFGLGDLKKAYEDFDQAYTKLRGNPIINYHQLGLPFRLYECEVLFNRGICQLYLGRIDAGLTDLYYAQKSKLTEEHDIIDQAVRDRGRNYSVYSIPPGVLFRPSETKMEQMRQFQEYQGGTGSNTTDNGYFFVDENEQGKRLNSVLIPPSAPWMQEIAKTDASYLAVPEPQRPQQQQSQTMAQNLERQQRPPSPEEPDPFMHDPVQPSLPIQQQQQQLKAPVIQTPKKKTYDPENTWKVVDRRTTTQKKEEARWLRPYDERKPSIAVSEFNNTFPIPAAQDNQADYTGTLDTMSYYGDDLDEELDRVYASLNAYLTTSNNNDNKTTHAQGRNKRGSISAETMTTIAVTTPPPSKPLQQQQQITNNKPLKKKKTNIYKYISQQPSSPDAKIKIKVHYHDTRILLVPSDIMFSELLTRVRAKFNASESLRLQYKDEENVMVLMIDQDDLNMARYLSRERNAAMTQHPVLEKLELWCISA
ncbi:hypothetical protein BDA99DRAFT_521594 [Phascolomyces articulosus]|uniref:PB1 domain-containing protein n=1 Tax=Phascolomyces articulosus TaxID=60185 RepID=A0AAD5K5V0_9FUNG|nr:hypothetical protein BDA99DRAFT_521594 [Phascolomyces articulosus]